MKNFYLQVADEHHAAALQVKPQLPRLRPRCCFPAVREGEAKPEAVNAGHAEK